MYNIAERKYRTYTMATISATAALS